MLELDPPIERETLELVLDEFPTAIRNRGEKYRKTGRVQRLWSMDEGSEFRGIVRGTSKYQVVLKCVDYEWLHRCTCPMEFTCKHSYAVVKKVLIKTEDMEYCDNLDEGFLDSAFVKPKAKTKRTGKLKSKTIKSELVSVLGRKLTPKEKEYAEDIQDAWRNVKSYNELEDWHLRQLGLGIPKKHTEGNLMIWDLLAKGTIEEKTRIMQTQKQALAEDVLGEEKFAKALSLDDFKFLFSD